MKTVRMKMDNIKIANDGALSLAVHEANEICLEPIRCHWDGTLFCGNLDTSEKRNIIEDIRFKLGFDHIELLDSTITRRENIQLLTSIGSLETLSMTLTFQACDTVINGKIRICSVLYEPIVSIYKLHLSKVVMKSIVGLCIVEDSYHITHIKHEFLDACISLMYKKASKMIPVYHKVQVKCIKHSLAHYILQNSMKNDISVIESKLHAAINLTSVSISLKGNYAYRNLFRSHVKTMSVTFNKLVDEIIDSTNLVLIQKSSKISLPNMSVILDFKKNEKKSVQALSNSLTGLNFLLRVNTVSISVENDIILIHAPVDFADLNIRYNRFIIKHGDKETKSSEIEEHYKTVGSYLTLSVQSVTDKKIDVNLIDFKIANLTLLDTDYQPHIDPLIKSWIKSNLEFKVVPIIEETFEKYLRMAMGNEKFATLSSQTNESIKL